MIIKFDKADPLVLGKLSYFKKLAHANNIQSRQNLTDAAKLSGFKSYHDLSKTIRIYFDLSVEEFIKRL
jgi:hypothetical protein